MSTAATTPKVLTGRCGCNAVTYTLHDTALAVHCCHCTDCQRESGAAFALNIWLEAFNFEITSETKPVLIDIPSESGKGQLMARCPTCQIALYSHYGHNKKFVWVRAGTLKDGAKNINPNVHIFTRSKVQWLDLSKEAEKGVPVFEEYYASKEDVWSKESLERYHAALDR
ncbi:glutathione-dependent formaldehyde-activating protein [Dendryphion nanum]|uniref:Glutathione-dependent formaldehyde-activating protein n=1 Tax=Dendryphion nanum TaxID=256645 RepID=A0A9P9DWA7_9PLEO|nr:glutathione-dependent formaldehyde-activating protein [Dendryphion nanum]